MPIKNIIIIIIVYDILILKKSQHLSGIVIIFHEINIYIF